MDYQTKLPKFLLELSFLLCFGQVTAADLVHRGLQLRHQKEFLCIWLYSISPEQPAAEVKNSALSLPHMKVICRWTFYRFVYYSKSYIKLLLPTLQLIHIAEYGSWMLRNGVTRLWRCPLQCHIRPSLPPDWRNPKTRCQHAGLAKKPQPTKKTKKTNQNPHTLHMKQPSVDSGKINLQLYLDRWSLFK